MADNDEFLRVLGQFREITGVDEERARFYLEASNGELQSATAAFFEGGELEEIERPSRPAVGGGMASGGGATGGGTATSQARQAVVAPQPAVVPPRSRPVPPRGGLMTMDALLHAEEDSSEDEDDKPQAFYAGGSMSSGQQVLGPPRSRDEMIADMFKKAREMGAQEVAPQMFKKKSNDSFGGAGYKLGEGGSGGSTSSSTSANAGAEGSEEVRDVVLHLWSNGFTVDDGPLRSYQDPANLAFLDSVKRGEVPVELRQKLTGQDCTLSIMDKRGQDYVPPKGVSVHAFAGKGQTLGSPVPVTVTSASSAASSSEDERKVNETAARSAVGVVPGEATTNIQFRLMDGSRLAAQFNHTHTVEDLYTFINAARPEYASASYLLTLFPNVQLTEKSTTLKDANVLNSSLIQKMKM